MNAYETFLALHHQASPVLIGNAWDVTSARVFERNGFKAIATSSSAIARSMGYEDGENIPFDLLVQVVERIINSVHIPLSVDIERGYGRDISQVTKNLERLYDLGVVGFNIEDSNKSEKFYMLATDEFQRILAAISGHLAKKNMHMFINARTDAFLVKLPSPLAETLERIKVYENAGASGIFVPFVSDKNEIRTITSATKLPVNVLCMPELPAFNELAELGVKRISMGGAIQIAATRSMEITIQSILRQQSFRSLYE